MTILEQIDDILCALWTDMEISAETHERPDYDRWMKDIDAARTIIQEEANRTYEEATTKEE